jgi:hypothetical protein
VPECFQGRPYSLKVSNPLDAMFNFCPLQHG